MGAQDAFIELVDDRTNAGGAGVADLYAFPVKKFMWLRVGREVLVDQL